MDTNQDRFDKDSSSTEKPFLDTNFSFESTEEMSFLREQINIVKSIFTQCLEGEVEDIEQVMISFFINTDVTDKNQSNTIESFLMGLMYDLTISKNKYKNITIKEIELDRIQNKITTVDINKMKELTEKTNVSEMLVDYIQDVVSCLNKNQVLVILNDKTTNTNAKISQISKMFAVIRNRDFVTPDDIQSAIFMMFNQKKLSSSNSSFDIKSLMNTIKLKI